MVKEGGGGQGDGTKELVAQPSLQPSAISRRPSLNPNPTLVNLHPAPPAPPLSYLLLAGHTVSPPSSW